MEKSYGMNFNAAYTQDESGKVTFGIHITDSDGMDINKDATGENGFSVISALCKSVQKDVAKINSAKVLKKEQAAAEQRRKERAEKEKQVAELRAKMAEIQSQIKAIEDEKAPESKDAKKQQGFAADADYILSLLNKMF